jgi:type II secretory pathway component PulF
MSTKFKFEARDATGKVVKGAVTASSQSEAIGDLRRRNLTPLNVNKAGGLASMFQKSSGNKRGMAKRASAL